jgi:two-component system sensor histidine kinase AtoS
LSKNVLKMKRYGRLRLLLVVLIVLSTGLLAFNVASFLDHDQGILGGGDPGDGSSRRQIVISGALHTLTLLAAVIVWFMMRGRERDQHRLRRSEHKHRTIINHAGEAIFLLDRQGRIREWNKAAETLFGAARRDVLGRPLQDVHHCDGLEVVQVMADAERLARSLTFEFPFRRTERPDGMIKLTISPLPVSAGAAGVEADEGAFVVIARDVTSERQLETRISQTEKLAGIGQLAAGIAHQLNTPLGSILLSAQMLSDAPLAEDEAEDVQRIIRQTEQCRQIIKGLLNFARPQNQERTLVPLGDVVYETVYLMEKNLKVAGVEVDLQPGDNPEVLGNRNELDQVVFNLLVNALDAMPGGGRVDIAITAADPGEIAVVFADSGAGIPPEHRDQIFLPFFTTKPYGKGTGLGLSIVARIMHEHGGRIEYDGTATTGARFVLTFPRPGTFPERSALIDDQPGTATT